MISVFSNMTHLRDEDAVRDQVNEDGRHVLSEGIFKKNMSPRRPSRTAAAIGECAKVRRLSR